MGADDVVVEVGPGLGSLTLALLETGARVVAIDTSAAEKRPGVKAVLAVAKAGDKLSNDAAKSVVFAILLIMLYLAFFTLMAWLLKKEYWRDVH